MVHYCDDYCSFSQAKNSLDRITAHKAAVSQAEESKSATEAASVEALEKEAKAKAKAKLADALHKEAKERLEAANAELAQVKGDLASATAKVSARMHQEPPIECCG